MFINLSSRTGYRKRPFSPMKRSLVWTMCLGPSIILTLSYECVYVPQSRRHNIYLMLFFRNQVENWSFCKCVDSIRMKTLENRGTNIHKNEFNNVKLSIISIRSWVKILAKEYQARFRVMLQACHSHIIKRHMIYKFTFFFFQMCELCVHIIL